MLRFTEYIAFGNLKKWGLNKHPDGGATRLLKKGIATSIDNGFIKALKAGKIEVVSQIKAFDKSIVRLVDGQLIVPYIVIAAMGYRTGLEHILLVPGVINELGVPTIHCAQQLKGNRGLFFTGMRPGLAGFFMATGDTGHKIACVIDAELRLKEYW